MTDINRAFMSWAPPASAARLLANEASARDVEPLAKAITERIVTQDELSGILTAGTRTFSIDADGTMEETSRELYNPPSDVERLAAVQVRVTAEIAAMVNERLASGLEIAGVGLVDVTQAALLTLGAKAQMATIAIQRESEFEAVVACATLDAEQTVDAYFQASTYVAAVEAHARELTASLQSAATAEEAASLTLTNGWPPAQPRVAGKFVKSTTPSPDA